MFFGKVHRYYSYTFIGTYEMHHNTKRNLKKNSRFIHNLCSCPHSFAGFFCFVSFYFRFKNPKMSHTQQINDDYVFNMCAAGRAYMKNRPVCS